MGRNMGLAIRVAQRVVGNAAEADDIGQEAFLRVWKRARSFDPRIARFTTWLYRIVLNLALDRIRKQAPLPIDDALEVPADHPEPLAVMIEDEERQAVAPVSPAGRAPKDGQQSGGQDDPPLSCRYGPQSSAE